jgi:hypothetical protein
MVFRVVAVCVAVTFAGLARHRVLASELSGKILCCCYHPTVPRRPFKSRFCERFNCPPLEYGERAFKECLHPTTGWLAAFTHWLRSTYAGESRMGQ